MAVTQQVLRLSSDILERARSEVSVLGDLIAFKLTAPADSLDLDWAPRGLERLARSALTATQHASILRALNGKTVVESAHADGARQYDVYSDITFLPAVEVREVEQTLGGIELAALVDAIPQERSDQLSLFGTSELPENPSRYYAEKFVALREFVRGAAARNLALVMWWD